MPLLENKSERLEYLQRLKVAAEISCREAYKRRISIYGAVNWADLHCVSAEYRLADRGDEFFAVQIEEAAPDAINLIEFIRGDLERQGFKAEVEVEW